MKLERLFLAIRSNDEVVYLAKVDSETSTRTLAQPGVRKPLHCTGLGKAFLSFEKESIRRQLLNTIPLYKVMENTIIDRDELKNVTSEYRESGYTIDDEENEIGILCFAAPIYGEGGEMVAAISCAGSKNRMLQKQNVIIKEIISCAKKISESQGYNGVKNSDVVTLGETMILFTPQSTLKYSQSYFRSIGGAESNVAIGLTFGA